jgi:hypothetical protein
MAIQSPVRCREPGLPWPKLESGAAGQAPDFHLPYLELCRLWDAVGMQQILV